MVSWVRFSIWHWLIVLVIVLLLFGRGKIPDLMGDVAKGIKSFKKGHGRRGQRRQWTSRPKTSTTRPTNRHDDHREEDATNSLSSGLRRRHAAARDAAWTC